jgi:hypothetical protein
MGLALVGDLANDLDDNVGVGALSVDIGNADLGVLEVKALDALVDSLGLLVPTPSHRRRVIIPSVLRKR